MADRKLTLTSWQSEFETIDAFQPDYHIPTDVSDYEDLPAEERAERILECNTVFIEDGEIVNDEYAAKQSE